MSAEYDTYLRAHIDCVNYAYSWILAKIGLSELQEIFEDINLFELTNQLAQHDKSKYSPSEYDAYDKYFYSEQTDEVKNDFDYAWLHHIHANPHHWQHWILKEDDSLVFSYNVMPVKTLEIPDKYILEMICDWWSFSWKNYIKTHRKESLYEVFNWYDDHINKIVMHDRSRDKVHKLLDLIKAHLDQLDDTIDILPSLSNDV